MASQAFTSLTCSESRLLADSRAQGLDFAPVVRHAAAAYLGCVGLVLRHAGSSTKGLRRMGLPLSLSSESPPLFSAQASSSRSPLTNKAEKLSALSDTAS